MPFCFYVAIVVMNKCVYGDGCVCVFVSVVEGCLRFYFSIILLADKLGACSFRLIPSKNDSWIT